MIHEKRIWLSPFNYLKVISVTTQTGGQARDMSSCDRDHTPGSAAETSRQPVHSGAGPGEGQSHHEDGGRENQQNIPRVGVSLVDSRSCKSQSW